VKTIIDKIQNSFIEEAKNSPILLSDLANMEFYIAESYQNRSFIELLQNADDASSKRVYLKSMENILVFANDGDYFTDTDVESICRSGASGKKRGNNTIGYRGIGFKSVVNICEKVHIFSNDIKMTFCKELTKKLLEKDLKVPLIRIPHHFSNNLNNEVNEVINNLINNGYKSIFIFENAKRNNVNFELENFDTSSLLFLRNINELKIDTNVIQNILIKRNLSECYAIVSIESKNNCENWLVVKPNNSNVESIAFLMNENKEIVHLHRDRAVAHSFLPTQEYTGFPFKLNGDFSTDPSRTKVTLDEFTEKSINMCVEILIDFIKFVITNDVNIFKVRSLLKTITKNEKDITTFIKTNTFKSLFYKKFKEELNRKKWLPNEKMISSSLKELHIKPNWLNKDDFIESAKTLSLNYINPSIEDNLPEINEFCIAFGAKQLAIKDVLKACCKKEPSTQGGLEILSETIKKYRYTLETADKDLIKNAKILKFDRGYLSLNESNKNDVIDENEVIPKN